MLARLLHTVIDLLCYTGCVGTATKHTWQ